MFHVMYVLGFYCPFLLFLGLDYLGKEGVETFLFVQILKWFPNKYWRHFFIASIIAYISLIYIEDA